MGEKPEAVRSEFLFCYDARMCNPNGDPDENRPRIDRLTGKNLVTEFRLKRTIRDYLKNQMGEPIFLREEMNERGDRKQIEDLADSEIKNFIKKGEPIRDALLEKYIDLRLFGLLFAVEGIESKGKKVDLHFKQTGPVQFAIGQSLNKVDEIPLRMTRVIPTSEGAKGGTFGEKSILRYSFITFHGFLNDYVAKETNLLEGDVSRMMKAMWFGTTDLSTASKYGQQSRLLVRVKYKNPCAYIGDLDRTVLLESTAREKLEDISQITLDVSGLLRVLTDGKELQGVEWACDNDLRCRKDDTHGSFEDLIKDRDKETCVNLLEGWKQQVRTTEVP